MAKSLKTHKQYANRASLGFWGGLGAVLALFGFLTAAPAILAQNKADDGDEDPIGDIFMEAFEGTPPPPPVAESAPQAEGSVPPPPPQAAESAPPPLVINKTAGKPPLHVQPEPAAQAPAQTAQAIPNAPKAAGKPPLAAGREMPTAVLEPETPGTAPPSAMDERPLPVPPENVADTSSETNGDEYFLGPDELDAGREAGTNSVTMPIKLGALPSLPWETVDPSAPAANFISDSPLPQFDSSESSWKQMEIGQADVEETPPPPDKPSSVPSVTESAPEPETAPPPGPATDREHLRSLFNDMLPPPALGARPPAQSPPANPARPAETPGPASAPPPAAAAEVKKDQPGTAPAEQAVPVEPEGGGPDVEEGGYEGGSAILRAGGQLTVQGHFGEAAILPPLKNAPDLAAWMEAQKAGEKQDDPDPGRPADPAAKTPPAKTPARDGTKPKAAGAGPKAGAPVARPQLTLVNETGNDRMLEIYRSVLSQMGYTIVSAETRPPATPPTGQTVISYRPGLQPKARAVAAHLPGRKTLVEAPGGLPTEISILLR